MRTDEHRAAAGVKSAHRVLEILSFFARRHAPASLAVISRELGVPKSSCLALINTLEMSGFLYLVNTTAGYYPTRRWLELAQVIAANEPVVSRVRATMEDLCQEVGETIIFGRRSGNEVVYLDVVESSETLRYTALPGQMKPLHGTASGKALLSTLSAQDLRQTIAGLELVEITPRTITDPEKLEVEILAGRKRGWHVSHGENEQAALAIAVPVLLGDSRYVLLAAGPLQRLGERQDTVGASLVETGRLLETELR